MVTWDLLVWSPTFDRRCDCSLTITIARSMAFSTASLLVLKRLELRCNGVMSSDIAFERHIRSGSASHEPGSTSWAKIVRPMSSSPALRVSLKDGLETMARVLKGAAGSAKDLAEARWVAFKR